MNDDDINQLNTELEQDQDLADDAAQESDEQVEQEAEDTTDDQAVETEAAEEVQTEDQPEEKTTEETENETENQEEGEDSSTTTDDSQVNDNPNAKWYVVHTYSGHENKVANALRQRIESEHLENKIIDILVPTQDKIEIRGGKKEQVKEKIFPGYILVKMDLDDISWLAVRTTQGVTSFVGMGNKPTPIPEHEVRTIIQYMGQGAAPTFKDVFLADDTVKIIDGPFAEFIGKVESVDKERGKVKVLVSIFGRETPVELDFLQVAKL